MMTVQKQIALAINEVLDPYTIKHKEQEFDYTIDFGLDISSEGYVEVLGAYNDEYRPDKKTNCVLLRLFINSDLKQGRITNIFLPEFLKHERIGKRIIHEIFTLLNEEEYSLFLVDMVDSFYRKMIKRGAVACVEYEDAVQIVNETKLL